MPDITPAPQQNVFERIKHLNEHGSEFWSARELAKVLDYAEYRNFQPVIEKAAEACANSQHAVADHFVGMHEMVEIGSGAMPEKSFAAKERRERKARCPALPFGCVSLRSVLTFAANSPMKTINELCDIVRETAYAIHLYHAHGHLEKVYENALANRLRKAGLKVVQQHPLTVHDEDGTVIGEYFADLLVEDTLVVELKACRALGDDHTAKILGYLKSARREHGVLINFGSYKFQIQKYVLSENGRKTRKMGGGAASLLFALLAFFRG